MIARLKERPDGGFYCSECRISTPDPVEICPFCGSIMTNWEDIIIQLENDRVRHIYNIDPKTGKIRSDTDESNIHGRN